MEIHSPTAPTASEAHVRTDVIIVGAGLAGLLAARVLRAAGRSVVIIDKGKSVGGRLATRRLNAADDGLGVGVGGGTGVGVAEGSSGDARLDHGAQFFTVRSPVFRELVDEWIAAGWVREWCKGFTPDGDGYPRYVGVNGMNALAKQVAGQLVAQGVRIHTDCTVHSVGGDVGELSVTCESDSGVSRLTAPVVVLTAPVPQSLALVDNGWLPLDKHVRTELERVTYVPCLALLARVRESGLIREPGGMQLAESDDPVWSFVGDNQRKRVSTEPAITFHANEAVSRARFDDHEEEVHAFLRRETARIVGAEMLGVSEYKRWRYARPEVLHPDRYLLCEPLTRTALVFAGDAFFEARVEGAALSGLAAGAAAEAAAEALL